ncbi:MAG: LemA family protein [Planctomycetes bacterium]|nr:LemA family protein [Planctomycetota bacterium]
MSTFIPFLVIGILGAVVLLWGVMAYNRLVTLRQRVGNAFAQIDVQLKRRYDLIPNLVAVAKRYLEHERGTLEAVTAARGAAVAAQGRASTAPTDGGAIQGLMAAEGALSGSLGRLFALAESYPQLKADATMRDLTEELTATENKVGFARQAFNDAVTAYNTACEVIPDRFVAGLGGFQRASLFEITQTAEREAPKVSF